MAKKETAFGADRSYRDYSATGKAIGESKDLKAIESHLKVMLGPDIPQSQRSAAIMQHCSDADISLFEPFVKELILVLQNPIHNSGPRTVFRILERLKVDEENLGTVVDLAFQYLADYNSAVASKAFAMGVISKQLTVFPELKNELGILMQGLYPTGSPGVKARIRSISKRHKIDLEM